MAGSNNKVVVCCGFALVGTSFSDRIIGISRDYLIFCCCCCRRTDSTTCPVSLVDAWRWSDCVCESHAECHPLMPTRYRITMYRRKCFYLSKFFGFHFLTFIITISRLGSSSPRAHAMARLHMITFLEWNSARFESGVDRAATRVKDVAARWCWKWKQCDIETEILQVCQIIFKGALNFVFVVTALTQLSMGFFHS